MNKITKPIIIMVLSVVLSDASLNACGWSVTCCNQNQGEATQVLMQGQVMLGAFITANITALQELYRQDPGIFIQFANACLQNIQGKVPDSWVSVLTQLNLIQDDGTISQSVINIISMAVDPQPDGSIKIWSLDDLIQAEWVKVLTGK
jgi:hypothetical protein